MSRASSHGVTLAVNYKTIFPRNEKGQRLPAFDMATGCAVNGTNEQRQAALADLEKFATPAESRDIEVWLAELSLITASRGRDGVENELMVTAYSSRLSQYPADVVRDALLKRAWKWWPTWEELERACEAATAPRRHMIAALKRPEPKAEPDRRPPNDEERKRIADLIAGKFPNVPQAWRDRAEEEIGKGTFPAEEQSQ